MRFPDVLAILLVIILVVSLLGIIGGFLQGCSAIDIPVQDPNADPNDNWFLYHSGTIAAIYYFQNGGYDRYYKLQFDFDDGEVIRMNYLESKSRPKIGDYGALFIERGHKDFSPARIQNASFKWTRINTLSDSKAKIILAKKIKSTKTTSQITIDGQWKYPAIDVPPFGQTVLAKLKDGSFAAAYLNNKRKWKFDCYRSKLSGGLSINNVEKWKEIDLN